MSLGRIVATGIVVVVLVIVVNVALRVLDIVDTTTDIVRGGSGVEIRVYFRADSGSVSGYVSAERDGRLARVCC